MLLLVLSQLQFGARDLGFSYLGSGVRTDKHMWSGLTKKLKMQSDYPNVFGTSGDDRPDETTDPGIATIPPGGTDPAQKSVLTDTTWDLRYVGSDAAQSPRLGFQSGARQKPTLERAQPVYAVSEPTLRPKEQIATAVTGPSVGLADLETMLKRLLPSVPAQAPPPLCTHIPRNYAETPASVYTGTGTTPLCTHGPRNYAEAPASGRTGTGTAASPCTQGVGSHVETPASRNTDTGTAPP